MDEYNESEPKPLDSKLAGSEVDQELKTIEAFDLVTDALRFIDQYQIGKGKESDLLEKAEVCLEKALKSDPTYFRAKYFLFVARSLRMLARQARAASAKQRSPAKSIGVKLNENLYINDKNDILKKFTDLPESAPDKRVKAEVLYNLATLQISIASGTPEINQKNLKTNSESPELHDAISNFCEAHKLALGNRDNPELRLLAGAGELVARSQRMTNEDRAEIDKLNAEIKIELRRNFFRWLIGRKSADRKVTKRVKKIIREM